MEQIRVHPEGGPEGTGIKYEVTEDHRALKDGLRGPDFEAEYRYHTKSETHMWTAIATYRLTEDVLANMDTEKLHMDSENLMAVNFGCFICETPYERKELKRRCKGEPKR